MKIIERNNGFFSCGSQVQLEWSFTSFSGFVRKAVGIAFHAVHEATTASNDGYCEKRCIAYKPV
jgi:hypothetical protein